MPNWNNLPPAVLVYAPGLVAFALALAGVALTRRAERWWPLAAALGLGAGWMLLVPSPAAWVRPRVVLEHLVVPAFVAVLGAAAIPVLRGRLRGWVAFAVLGVAGGWLAGAVRGEFWRAWFAVSAVAWLLRLSGARTAAGAALVAFVLLLGLVAAGAAPVWIGVAGVLLGAAAGVAALRPGAVLGLVAPAVGLVAIELGTGGLMRSRVDMMDLVCAGALLAPRLSGWMERAVGRRLGRFARLAAAGLTALAVVVLAWLAARLLHR